MSGLNLQMQLIVRTTRDMIGEGRQRDATKADAFRRREQRIDECLDRRGDIHRRSKWCGFGPASPDDLEIGILHLPRDGSAVQILGPAMTPLLLYERGDWSFKSKFSIGSTAGRFWLGLMSQRQER